MIKTFWKYLENCNAIVEIWSPHQKCWEVHGAITESYERIYQIQMKMKISVRRPKRQLLTSLHFHHNSHTDFSPASNFINEKISFHDVTRMFDVGRFYLQITFMNIPMLIISDFYDLHNIFRKLISWLGFLKETVIKTTDPPLEVEFFSFLCSYSWRSINAEFQRRFFDNYCQLHLHGSGHCRLQKAPEISSKSDLERESKSQ